MKSWKSWRRTLAIAVNATICSLLAPLAQADPAKRDKAPKLEPVRGFKAGMARAQVEELIHEERYEDAIVVKREECAFLEDNLSPTSSLLMDCLATLGWLHYMQGNYDEAERLLSRVLSAYEQTRGPEHADFAEALVLLADLYRARGLDARAEPLYLRALPVLEANARKAPRKLSKCLVGLASSYVARGAWDEAEPLFLRGLRVLQDALGPEHGDVVATLNNLGMLYQERGQLDEAERFHLRALEIQEGSPHASDSGLMSSLHNLATLYSRQGAFAKATPLLERALSIQESRWGSDHPDVAITINALAMTKHMQGSFDDAERLYRRSLDIIEGTSGEKDPFLATVTANLANLYVHKGDLRSAEPLAVRALALARETLGPTHRNLTTYLNVLASVYFLGGSPERAEPLLLRALELAEQGGPSLISPVIESLHNLGVLNVSLMRIESALELHRRALELEEANLNRTLAVADEPRRLSYASLLLGSTNIAYSLHLRVAPEQRATAELALTTLLRRKGRTQDLGARTSDVLRRSLGPEDQHLLADLARAQSQYAAVVLDDPDGSSRLAELQQEQDRIWRALARKSPTARQLHRSVSIPDVQAALARDAVLVELVRYLPLYDEKGTFLSRSGEPRYAAYLVFPESIDWVDLGPAEVIEEQVTRFRQDVVLGRAISQGLYHLAFEPVVARLGKTRELFLAPDGALNLVPFAALYDGERYLVERFALRYLTTGRDLLNRGGVATNDVAVVVGNPRGANLPGTDHEAKVLAELLPGDVELLVHDAATEARVRAHPRARILHLATHGTFDSGRSRITVDSHEDRLRAGASVFDGLPPTQLDNPMLYSWLDLATPAALLNGEPDEGADLDDGKLTAYEISGWDLRGTELVTLSACDTAQGSYQQGEGILGLRRAFAIAGAQTQVMSLWKVSDASTSSLMAAYYRRLLAGEGRSDAMRNTQLERLRHPETRHPRDWAAFVVVGEWGPLSGTTREGPEPIPPRPRGCQASVDPGADVLPPLALVLVALGAIRQRRRTVARRP